MDVGHAIEALFVCAALGLIFGAGRAKRKGPRRDGLAFGKIDFDSGDTFAGLPPAPQPEAFGLTAQEADVFKLFTRRDYLSEKVEVALLATAVLSVTTFLLYVWGWEHWGFALLVGFFAGGSLVGMPLAYTVKKIRNWKHARATRTLPNYPHYLRYEEAGRQHSAYVEALLSAKRQAETDSRIARHKEAHRELPRWKGLDGEEFERELVTLFKNRGYEVKWTGRGGGDEGVDILLNANGRKIIVQCKAHKRYIVPGVVRELYGTLIHHGADEAWLITTSGFFSGAKSFAQGKPIRLLVLEEVLRGEEFGSR